MNNESTLGSGLKMNADTIVYAGRLKNRKILLESSSGGAFIALSDIFINNGDAVVAAVYDYETHINKFQLILDRDLRDKARGSKYMQSDTGTIFQEAYRWLEANPDKKLLFIGVGCQADGFRQFAEIKGFRNRVTIVDIICHGSPSPKIWREYAQYLETKKQGKITFLTFKDKRNGWIAPTAYVRINNQEILLKNYVGMFYSKCALRPSCHKCKYAVIQRETDMTIGDFWHIEKTIPDFYDDEGTSLFLIHTKKGKQLFDVAMKDMDIRKSNTHECWQTNLEKPTEISPKREKFWKDYKYKGVKYVIDKYGRDPIYVRAKNKLMNKIKKILN